MKKAPHVDQTVAVKLSIDGKEVEFRAFSWQDISAKVREHCNASGFEIPARRMTALREMEMSGRVTLWADG